MGKRLPAKRPATSLSLPDARRTLLTQAGITEARAAELLTKSVAQTERVLTDPGSDAFAVIAAAKTIINLLGAAPSKSAQPTQSAQTPIIINIGELPPAPRGKVVNVTPSRDGAQVVDAAEGMHNVG